MNEWPTDYAERVYAGVLGKMIGVYLGRPIEGWTHQRILERFGEVRDYVHEAQARPLIVSDDDLSGTFAFVRAIAEHGAGLGAAEIGQTWLNQIVPGRTILWWGGMGNSTEETAYFRLKNGIPAPESGSIQQNGKLVAEQIGAQIFIDAWAMLSPNQPELAAKLSRAAARVSHDGEAVDAAVALAIMEALAFGPCTVEQLLDAAQASLPADGILHKLYQDLRRWHCEVPDWKEAFALLDQHYGYHLFPGNVHIIPNHGVIVLSLLYGNDDFEETLVICNTCGWDTDCNVGNIGALMGIRHGVQAIPNRWRAPVADQLFVCSAQGAQAITDAVRVTDNLLGLSAILHKKPLEKRRPRYHFTYPGSTQGFITENMTVVPRSKGLCLKVNGEGYATTATFLPPEVPAPIDVPYARNLGAGWNYTLLACPSLHSGQQLYALVSSPNALQICFVVQYYNEEDALQIIEGSQCLLEAGQRTKLEWNTPDLGAFPIARIGLKVTGTGEITLHELDWQGTPTLNLVRPIGSGQMWRRAWINAADRIDMKSPGLIRFSQHSGIGQMLLDAEDWTNFCLEAELVSILPAPFGIAVHTQGLRRHYALWLKPGVMQLVSQYDDQQICLAETNCEWNPGEKITIRLQVKNGHIVAGFNNFQVSVQDTHLLEEGGIAILASENCIDVLSLCLQPI